MKSWFTTNKTSWPRGEWDNEPDKAHWIDEKSQLDCLIVRGPTGVLCGYVGVPQSNKNFEKHYYDVHCDVHGGLTYAEFCAEEEIESIGVCHSKECAKNDKVWWLGFDCAHDGDLVPLDWDEDSYCGYKTYRNFNYVKKQVENLAIQLVGNANQ